MLRWPLRVLAPELEYESSSQESQLAGTPELYPAMKAVCRCIGVPWCPGSLSSLSPSSIVA